MYMLLIVLAVVGPAHAKTPGAAAIQHVVLLLMENRPFDHFYGFAQPVLTGKIDGLSGKECFPTRVRSANDTRWAKSAVDLEFDGISDDDDDGEDDGGDDDGGDRLSAPNRRPRKLQGDGGDDDGGDDDDDDDAHGNDEDDGQDDHPLDGKTQIMFNVFDRDSGAPEDKFVSFAYSAAPPGETGALHWLRATYTAVTDAMPTRFEVRHALQNRPTPDPSGVAPRARLRSGEGSALGF